MEPSDGTRRCLDCPTDGTVEKGKRSVRCRDCREQHARDKAADAQWDRRQRKRDEANARRARRGEAPYLDPLLRPRQRTPSWDQYGQVITEAPPLAPAQLRALSAALDELDRATAAVREALGPRG